MGRYGVLQVTQFIIFINEVTSPDAYPNTTSNDHLAVYLWKRISHHTVNVVFTQKMLNQRVYFLFLLKRNNGKIVPNPKPVKKAAVGSRSGMSSDSIPLSIDM
jgi:hypothetical protein